MSTAVLFEAFDLTEFVNADTIARGLSAFDPEGWLRELSSSGYEVHVVYVWLRAPELSIRRVRQRVREGGHNIPEDVIRRRYARSCTNLVSLYLPLATSWRIYDNSAGKPSVVGYQTSTGTRVIVAPESWSRIHEIAALQTQEPQDVG